MYARLGAADRLQDTCYQESYEIIRQAFSSKGRVAIKNRTRILVLMCVHPMSLRGETSFPVQPPATRVRRADRLLGKGAGFRQAIGHHSANCCSASKEDNISGEWGDRVFLTFTVERDGA